jgi:hypothetical protein
VPVVRARAQQLPLPDGTVTSVVGTYPGPWLLDPATWRELERVLRPGGTVAILLGGATTRGRGALARRALQRLAYGRASHDARELSWNGLGTERIRGAIEVINDAWGVAYVWRGVRLSDGAT